MSTEAMTHVERFDRAVREFRGPDGKYKLHKLDWGVFSELAVIEPAIVQAMSHSKGLSNNENRNTQYTMTPMMEAMYAIVLLCEWKATHLDELAVKEAKQAKEAKEARRREQAQRIIDTRQALAPIVVAYEDDEEDKDDEVPPLDTESHGGLVSSISHLIYHMPVGQQFTTHDMMERLSTGNPDRNLDTPSTKATVATTLRRLCEREGGGLRRLKKGSGRTFSIFEKTGALLVRNAAPAAPPADVTALRVPDGYSVDVVSDLPARAVGLIRRVRMVSPAVQALRALEEELGGAENLDELLAAIG